MPLPGTYYVNMCMGLYRSGTIIHSYLVYRFLFQIPFKMNPSMSCPVIEEPTMDPKQMTRVFSEFDVKSESDFFCKT